MTSTHLRTPPHPVSCHRIRQHLELDARRDGCNCVFRLDPDEYPAPLCHVDIFPTSGGQKIRRGPRPPDLDGDGRTKGYLSRQAKARATLARENRP